MPDSKKGFTLIEVLVAIAIVAVISSAGMITYSQTQKKARDAKRKEDLAQIAVALQIYYQKNGRYPGPTEWVNSSSSTATWIPGLDSSYTTSIPKDPLNTCTSSTTNPRDAGNNCFVYAYYSGAWNTLGTTNPGFILTTRLENTSDPQAGNSPYTGTSALAAWPESTNPCPRCYTIGNY